MDTINSFGSQEDDGVGEVQCRACLEKHPKHQLYSLDSTNQTILNDGSEQTIAEIYHQCTQLLYVSTDDGHCKWICQCCTEKMIDFYQFRKMCIDSYNKLKQTKFEAIDECGDTITYGMELDNAVAIKHEVSFDCNADRMIEQIEVSQINTDVNMDEPIQEAKPNASGQCVEEKTEDTKNSADFVTFDDFNDDDDDDDSDDSDDKNKNVDLGRKRNDSNNVKPPNQNGPIYACDKCPRKFFKEYRYDAHIRRHMGLKAYKCEQCDKEFQKMHTLKAHIAAKHYDETKGKPEYICDDCGKIYNRKASLRNHIKLVHIGRKSNIPEKICTECGKAFKNNAALIRHNYTHTKTSSHKCDVCSKMFPTAHKLKEHMMRHNGIKNHVCPTCGLRKISAHELRVHMKCHANVQYPCNRCSSVFRSDDGLRLHKQKIHCESFDTQSSSEVIKDDNLTSEVRYECDDSIAYGAGMPMEKARANTQVQREKEEKPSGEKNDINFAAFDGVDDEDDDSDDDEDQTETELSIGQQSNRRTATQAVKIQTELKNDSKIVGSSNHHETIYACDKCPKRFFREYRYNAHMRRHNGLKAYQCEQCDKSFQKLGTLNTHMEVNHSQGKPEYECDECGRIYNRKESLRIHIQSTHSGKKSNVSAKICEQCGKVFRNNAALIRHSYSHTKVTPHKCDICSKMFPTSHKLKEHMLRHNGIKNHVCPTCGLRKISGHELRVHMKCHSNVQHPCDMCSSVFTNIDNMRRHKQIVHCGLKPYKCPYCDQSFGKAETRKHHVARHTGEKPHACQICDKRFIQSVALKTHMKTHNKNK